MMLLTDSMVDVVMLTPRRVADGEGGFLVQGWEDGVRFRAAITLDTSTQARIAEHQGVTNTYTVTTPKNAVLHFHDVFRRVSDGKIFRVTSDGTDKHTPQMSTFQVSQVTAEEWKLSS